MTDAGVCDPASFLWPEAPLDESWWQLKGAMKRMPDHYVRFAAAAWRIGGRSNKKHLAAAKLAGLSLGRTEAFRVSATTSVRWLLAEAERVAKGQEPPLTEREIENELARMVRSGEPQVAAKAIELRDRREQRRLERGVASEDDGFGNWRLARDLLMLPSGGGLAAAAVLTAIGGGAPSNWALLHDVAEAVRRENPEAWEHFRQLGSDDARAELDRFLADPSWQADGRKLIWAEVGREPPGPWRKPRDPVPVGGGVGERALEDA